MKKLLQLVFILFVTSQTPAQNLVSNYSFENFTTCPFGTSQITNATGWSASLGNPDYYNVCANGSSSVGVPSNICGYQYPATGNAYAAVLCYGSFANTQMTDFREYCTGTLTQPLTVGVKYYVTVKVVRMNASSHAVNNIGAKFLMSATPALPITDTAQVYTTNVITDTLNWTLIQGSFIADSNYTFISIGNHFTDVNTTILSLQPVTHGWNAYYFIDDVCVSTDSLTCMGTVGNDDIYTNKNVAVFPNPFTNKITITAINNEQKEITLYDMYGRIVLAQPLTANSELNTQNLPQGIYLYEVKNKQGVIKKGKVVKQ